MLSADLREETNVIMQGKEQSRQKTMPLGGVQLWCDLQHPSHKGLSLFGMSGFAGRVSLALNVHRVFSLLLLQPESLICKPFPA